MEKTYKSCQSCGMPLKKDPKLAAPTPMDRSASSLAVFASNYQFLLPDTSAEQMNAFVKNKPKELGFHGFLP